MTYLHVTLEVRAAEVARFKAVMARIQPVVEGAGWKLAGAFQQRTGKLNTIIDLWELEDMGAYDRALGVLVAHPDFAQIKAELDACVESETVVFADRITY